MSNITVKNLSKKYIISSYNGRQPLLRDRALDLIKNPFNIFGKEKYEDFWALNNISFKVDEGETLGLIGMNGAGKSTLLKILSRITQPTKGEAVLRGRVASLLEVGTGFHPELTGRENVYLNGSIFDMHKEEINKRFNKIVKFSEIEKFIDMPVKKYSSGMFVRLAFSVAAHLETDILLIDEVLAVGDIGFRKKCIEKIEQITTQSGKTVIIVGHNMNMIRRLCNNCMLLNQGQVLLKGITRKVVDEYINLAEKSSGQNLKSRTDRKGAGRIKLTDIFITNHKKENTIKSGDRLRITIKYYSDYVDKIDDVRITIGLFNSQGYHLSRFDNKLTNDSVESISTKGTIICDTDRIDLDENTYSCAVGIYVGGKLQDHLRHAVFFKIKRNYKYYNFKSYDKYNFIYHKESIPLNIKHKFYQENG